MSGECEYCGSDQHGGGACPKTKDPVFMWRDGYASGYAAGWNANNTKHVFETPPPGHIVDELGTVRRVLGTLPVTKDGCVIGDNADMWFYQDTTGVYGISSHQRHYEPVPPYSTEQAAREEETKS